ncbi:MAG: EAL domain-containing protein [Telmatospirillum sp.]|nr:EAL domain-containing protein [Telmatospirillum sp.]
MGGPPLTTPAVRRVVMPAQIGFLLLILWGFVFYWSFSERARVLTQTEISLRQLTVSVQEQTLRLFKMTETALLVESDWLAAHPGAYPNDDPSFVALVNQQIGLSDGFLDFRTLEPDGGVRLIPSLSRDAVRRPAGPLGTEGRSGGVRIGAPETDAFSGGWIIPVTLPVPGKGRRPSGPARRATVVLAGIIELDRLARLFDAQRMRPNGSITILRSDGITLFRAPAPDGAIGRSIAGQDFFNRRLAVADHGIERTSGVYDTLERVVSFQRLNDYPVTVIVSAAYDDVLQPWRHETAILAGIGGLVTLFTGFLTGRFISLNRVAQKRIEFLAFHDALTGLPNRELARDRFLQIKAYADRAGAKAALLFLDVDNFKMVNDSLGHTIGDALLRKIAERLGRCVRQTDTIARLGGDEFLVLLGDIGDDEAVTAVAEQIRERLEPSFDIDEHSHLATLSIGIAVYPDDGLDFETLLKKADTAMYRSKEAGRNIYRFYNDDMNAKAVETLNLRNGLRRALLGREFVLYYQPQIELVNRTLIGVEALVRWKHPELGMIPPDRFISIAEDSGQIVEIGAWVIEEACRQAVAWHQAGLPPFVVAVNLSALQFRRGNLAETVSGALERSGLDPRFLELELTESILIRDLPLVMATVQRLKRLGLRLSIDDFGTGYSSFSYLKKLKVDKLKIDQSFVRDVTRDPDSATIVQTIIRMAKSLNLGTIAEGVEDETTLAFLVAHQCDAAQGYHFGRPMAPDALAAALRGRQVLVV